MDLLRRRNMMQGADGPVFVDWIENVGDASTEFIPVPSVTEESYLMALDIMCPTTSLSNTAWMSFHDERNYWMGFYMESNQYRLWMPSIRQTQSSTYSRTGGRRDIVYIAYQPPYQTRGYAIGVNNANWGDQGDVKSSLKYIQILRSRSGHTNDYKLRLYGVVLTSRGTTLLNLRPCFYRGEYGLWESVSNTFYGNTVEGASFTGGYDE